jgi:uncharacterized protein
MRINGAIDVPDAAVADFCRKWRVTQIEVFGSALREDFRPDSDVDLLVTFERGSQADLFDLIKMRDEMSELIGRPADLFERAGVEKSRNPYRKQAILSSAQPVYRVA